MPIGAESCARGGSNLSSKEKDALMNTILLLKQKTEPTDLVPRDPLRFATRADDATPGCTCDRWGHPCDDCVELKPQAPTTRRNFSLVKK